MQGHDLRARYLFEYKLTTQSIHSVHEKIKSSTTSPGTTVNNRTAECRRQGLHHFLIRLGNIRGAQSVQLHLNYFCTCCKLTAPTRNSPELSNVASVAKSKRLDFPYHAE